MSVYDEILTWSQGLPDWQRDALRRLVGGTLTPDDLAELEALSLKPHAFLIDGYEQLEARPLAAGDLPIGQGAVGDVTLQAVSAVKNVNLIDDASVLNFGPIGLTIIYGYNGSGKSGYVRILKRLCRARGGGATICPNIFEIPDGSPAGAVVTFTAGGTTEDHCWSDGTPGPSQLGRISIFDSNCAEFYVTKENDVAYRPFGLDLFDTLASAADQIQARLTDRKTGLATLCPPVPEWIAEAPVIKALFPITAKKNPAAVDQVLDLNGQEVAELASLKRIEEEADPVKRAASLRARKGLLMRAHATVTKALAILSAAKIGEFAAHKSALATAQKAASLVSKEAFKDMLPGTGDDPWKALWEHARKYAAIAYPDQLFPNVTDGALCLLCQQPLSDDAKEQFGRFEAFVKHETANTLTKAQTQITADQEAITAAKPPTTEEDVLNELRAISDDACLAYEKFKRDAAQALTDLTGAFASGEWESVTVPVYGPETLKETADRFETEALAVLSADDDAERAVRKGRIEQFEARKWIFANRVMINADIERCKQANLIDKALETTKTNRISLKSKELTETHVTDALRKAVEAELKAINANHLRITLGSRSDKGSTLHHIEIKGRKIDKVAVRDIVSEGEFRAIGIAAFLAELGQTADKSAIVVDDPVSSLDHLLREKVAGRLIEEAKGRQVVVFTHEVLFMHALLSLAEEQGMKVALRQVTRGDTKVGIVSEDVPWDTQTVKQRLDFLRRKLAEVRKEQPTNKSTYEALGRDWYGHVRETWELAIEELVLNKAIQRLSLDVQTKRLAKVVDFTQDDYRAVEVGMSKASRWMRGHTKPAADTTPFPEPYELDADLKALADFADAMRKRRN